MKMEASTSIANYQSSAVREYTDLSPVAHWVYAPDEGGQIITLGEGDDYVDVARSNGTGADDMVYAAASCSAQKSHVGWV